MYNVEVSPKVKQSTHHISLTDGKKTLGLIICDSKGAADPFNISASPNQRSSLRTKSGTTKYEDLEEPWSATAQDDWSGGRALEDYEQDTTRFYDSKRCQTAFNQIYNAPLEYYATGLKDAVTNWPGSVKWRTVYAGNAIAYQLDLQSSMTAGEIYILLRRRGTPAAGLVVDLSSDIGGVSVLESHTYTTAEITDVLSEWKKFTFADRTLTAGTYFIRVTSEGGDTNDHWQIGLKPDSYELKTYINSGGWNLLPADDLYYRIAAADTGRMTRFFTYRQLTFALTQMPTGDPRLYVNGDLADMVTFELK